MPTLAPPPLNTPLDDGSGQVSALWGRWYVDQQRVITLDVAPANARYVVTTANPSLTAEVNLGALSAGYLKQTVAAGVAAPATTATIPATDLSGTLPDAVFPATLPVINGSAVTNLNASALASGTIPDARIPNPLPAVSGAALTSLNASALASGTVANARLPETLLSGTYTPTLTNVANLDASTAYSCQYLRVGSVVTVSGRVDVDPTAAVATQLGISLPVASNLANANECAGTGFASAIAGQGAAIRGDATNDRAEMVWTAVDITNQPMFFSFCYRVI